MSLSRTERKVLKLELEKAGVKVILRPGETGDQAISRTAQTIIRGGTAQAASQRETIGTETLQKASGAAPTPMSQAQATQLVTKSQQNVARQEAMRGTNPTLRTQGLVGQQPILVTKTVEQRVNVMQGTPTTRAMTEEPTKKVGSFSLLTPEPFRNYKPSPSTKETFFSQVKKKEQELADKNFSVLFTNKKIKLSGWMLTTEAGTRTIGSNIKSGIIEPITSSKIYQDAFGVMETKQKELIIGRGGRPQIETATRVVERTPAGYVAKITFKASEIATTVSRATDTPLKDLMKGEITGKSISERAFETARYNEARGLKLLGFAQAIVGGSAEFLEKKPVESVALFGTGYGVGVAAKTFAPLVSVQKTLAVVGTAGEGVLIGTSAFAIGTAGSYTEAGRRTGMIATGVGLAAGGFKLGSESQLATNLQKDFQQYRTTKQFQKEFIKMQKERGIFEFKEPEKVLERIEGTKDTYVIDLKKGRISAEMKASVKKENFGFEPVDKSRVYKGTSPEFAGSGERQLQLISKKYDPLNYPSIREYEIKPQLLSDKPLYSASQTPSQTRLKLITVTPKEQAFIKITKTNVYQRSLGEYVEPWRTPEALIEFHPSSPNVHEVLADTSFTISPKPTGKALDKFMDFIGTDKPIGLSVTKQTGVVLDKGYFKIKPTQFSTIEPPSISGEGFAGAPPIIDVKTRLIGGGMFFEPSSSDKIIKPMQIIDGGLMTDVDREYLYRTEQEIINIPDVIQDTDYVQDQDSAQKVITRTVGSSVFFDSFPASPSVPVTPPPTPSPVFEIPVAPPLTIPSRFRIEFPMGGGERRMSVRPKTRQQKGYAPTLFSTVLKIKGKEKKKITQSGLGIRPLPLKTKKAKKLFRGMIRI